MCANVGKTWTKNVVYFIDPSLTVELVKLPTYSSPRPTLTLTSLLGENVGLGEA